MFTSLNVKNSRFSFKTVWLWHFFYSWQFWKCWTRKPLGSWCNSVQVHRCSLTSDPTRWRLTTFLHPRQLNWSVSVPVTGSSLDNDQLSQLSRASPRPAFLPLLFLSDSKIQDDPIHGQHRPSCWPTSKLRSSQTCGAGPLILRACSIIIAGPPSHSAAANRKPAISNLTHFSNC